MFRYQTCHQASYHHEGISTQHHNPSPPPPISPPSPQALIMSLVLGSAVVSGLTLNADAVLQVMGLDPQTSDPHLVDMARDFLAVRWVMDETLPLSHFRLNKYRQVLLTSQPKIKHHSHVHILHPVTLLDCAGLPRPPLRCWSPSARASSVACRTCAPHWLSPPPPMRSTSPCLWLSSSRLRSAGGAGSA